MHEHTLRHLVLFSFRADANPGHVQAIEQAFCALPDQIPGIIGFEWGTNVSPEGLAQGFTHCFFVTFGSEEERDAYLPHPAHRSFGEKLQPILDNVLVIDYWTQ